MRTDRPAFGTIARYAAGVVVALAVVGTGLDARQSVDRSKPPVPGPPPVLKLPPIEKRTLSNGLHIWIVEMHEVPVVDVLVVVKSGSAADPAGKFGLANFTAAMLDEGAGRYSALELSDAVEFLGASLTTSSSFDASNAHLHTPASKFDAALPLLADVVLRPTFADSELERVRKERLTSLLQTRDNASSLASAAFARVLFGPHRYGTPMIGTTATNNTMMADDLRGFHAAHYQPQNAFIIVTGDVIPATLVPKLEGAFGGWKNTGSVPHPALAAAAQPAARQIYLVDKPAAAQSQIRIGGIGVARTTSDYHVLDVLNTILGGSFTSRLNQNLREQHGYTYGASSTFDMRGSPGPFLAGAGVQTDKTVESLHEFFKELEGMHATVPAAELSRARNLEALGFPGAFETTEEMTRQLATLAVYDLPDSFFSEYVPKIQAVTAADLQRAAAQYLPTDRFAVVVVGDLSKIEQPIRAANLGPVKILTPDEVLQ